MAAQDQKQELDLLAVKDYLVGLQASIVEGLEAIDGGRFRRDEWQRAEGGGGITCVIEDSAVLERGGVLFSHVRGNNLPPSASAHRPEIAGRRFEAMGVSLVLHPRNPYAPTVHLNVRFFVALPKNAEAGEAPVWWFGGGMDLTPYYAFEDDARHFHQVCRTAVSSFGASLHPRFKRWCDEYFYLKHRAEPRGIGGLFFDDLSDLPDPPPELQPQPAFARTFALQRAVGDAFLPAYAPILSRRHSTPYGEREREWQAYRRGRYVEFNLVFDRGTLFGLQSGGRTESILCSMPPKVSWRYDYSPAPDSPEGELYRVLMPPRDWA